MDYCILEQRMVVEQEVRKGVVARAAVVSVLRAGHTSTTL